MKINENPWERKLNISTSKCNADKEDEYHYSYEPTPYGVLERLVESNYISDRNIVLDYGCGKGRVGFFLSNQLKCKVIGIDFDEQMCEAAQKNLLTFTKKNAGVSIEFFCESAETYEVIDADIFYFFNPFSIEILCSVIGKIIKSYYNQPREMRLLFYYPSDEYISYLMTVPELCFVDEIDCSDLFLGYNQREKILIFEVF